MREAVLTEEHGEIVVSVWNLALIDSLEEGTWYAFHSMVVMMFNTLKLATALNTVIMRCVQIF